MRSRSPARQSSIGRGGSSEPMTGALSKAYEEHRQRQGQHPQRQQEDYDPGRVLTPLKVESN